MKTAHDADRLRLFDVSELGESVYHHQNTGTAEIAVIVPLYNYAQYVEDCLYSVVKQDLETLSIVVIDDCSTDHGGDLAIRVLESNRQRFVSARVVRHRRNQGLAMTRNSGIAWSQEPLLFMLDADNRIRPPALSRLAEALRVADREFAYSQVCRFGDFIGFGDADIWDPGRFRHGNYIDGMALIRRTALLAVKGYRLSAVEDGWEDFDLWCQFAELGFSGVYLPEPLCEYRVHSSSMVHTQTNHKRRSLSLEMVLRHPTLFADGEIPPFVDRFPPDSR